MNSYVITIQWRHQEKVLWKNHYIHFSSYWNMKRKWNTHLKYEERFNVCISIYLKPSSAGLRCFPNKLLEKSYRQASLSQSGRWSVIDRWIPVIHVIKAITKFYPDCFDSYHYHGTFLCCFAQLVVFNNFVDVVMIFIARNLFKDAT